MFIPFILPLYFLIFWTSRRKALFYIGLFILFFLSVFRATSVGVDTISYMAGYQYAQASNFQSIWGEILVNEPVYFTIEYLCARIGLSYRFFMGIQSILFLAPIAIGMRRINERSTAPLAFLLLLGFFFGSLNITRQLIAVSFCFLAFVLLEEKKYIWSAIITILAIGFHTTAALSLIVFILPFINIKQIKKIWLIAILLASYAVPIVVNLSSYLTDFTNSLSIFETYSLYLDDDFTELGRLPIYNTLRTGLFIFAIYNYNITDNKQDIFYKIAFLAVIVHNLIYGVPSYVSRVAYYFDISFIVFFVRWGRKNNIATFLTLSYAALFYIHQFIMLKHDGVIPFILDI